MNSGTIMLIIAGIICLVSSEILYIFFMRKTKDIEDWVTIKVGSIMIGAFISIVFLIIFYAIKDFPEITLESIIAIALIYLYFRTNYDIGKYLVKKNQKNEKKRRKNGKKR